MEQLLLAMVGRAIVFKKMPKGYAKIGRNKGWFLGGVIPWNKGKKMTKEYKERCKQQQLGKIHSIKSNLKRSLTLKKLYKEGKHKGGFQKGIALRKGVKVSKKTREKMSLAKKGQKPWNKGKRNIFTNEGLEKLRIARQKQIIKNNHGINIGKNEKRILDELELSFGYKIIRQYPIKGYFLDGYIPELNLALEIDEKFHERRKEKDKIKQENIQKELNCDFIRILDY